MADDGYWNTHLSIIWQLFNAMGRSLLFVTWYNLIMKLSEVEWEMCCIFHQNKNRIIVLVWNINSIQMHFENTFYLCNHVIIIDKRNFIIELQNWIPLFFHSFKYQSWHCSSGEILLYFYAPAYRWVLFILLTENDIVCYSISDCKNFWIG